MDFSTLETGHLVFFFPRKRQIVALTISWGQKLWWRFKKKKVPKKVPHHVGILDVERGKVRLWEALAGVGFISRPFSVRVSRLHEGVDYEVVRIVTHGHKTKIDRAIQKYDGLPYEKLLDVARVWRGGNKTKGWKKLYCAEVVLRVLVDALLPWAFGRRLNNESPLSLYAKALEVVEAEKSGVSHA
jgi:hypothetical protein